MTVKDIMQTSVIRVSEDTPIKEVARIIFSTGISGAPVLSGKKLVGIITEEDILSKVSSSNRNGDLLDELLEEPVIKVMNKQVVTIPQGTNLLEAEKIMLDNNFSRLPVVDEKGNLIGIVSQGDIFRQVLKDKIPQMEKERYATFISRYYDVMIDWDQRFEYEFPSLQRIFNREKVEKVLDLGVWTGLYSIGLAREGINITGLDNNSGMIAEANKKREELPKKIQDKLEFKYSDFSDVRRDVSGTYDAVISMGNSFPYLPGDTSKILQDVSSVLKPKRGIIIFQILNVPKVLEKKQRLLNFRIQKSDADSEKEHLFLEFFDDIENGLVNHNLMVFDSDGVNWIYKGMTTVPIKNITQDDIEKYLIKAGFTDISFAGYNGDYQGDYGPMSFIKPFEQKSSDWMTVFARKK